MKNIYIDGEWFANQTIFLIGYSYNSKEFGQLYGSRLTKASFLKILEPVNGFIFFYGPDIGMLEKFFDIDIRHNYKCINLLPLFKHLIPELPSYKLAFLEKLFGIKRTTFKYKQNIRELEKDWLNPRKRKLALQYNKEDVIFLYLLKSKIFADLAVKSSYLKQHLFK